MPLLFFRKFYTPHYEDKLKGGLNMSNRFMELAKGAFKVTTKIGKKVLIEGSKVAAAGAIIVGMESIYRGGVKQLKETSLDTFLENEEDEEDEDFN